MVGREEAWPERRDVDAHECRTRQEREEKWKKKKKEEKEEKEVLSFPRLGIGVHDTSAGTRIQHVPRPDRYFRYSHGSGSAAIKTADNTGPILENRLTIFSLPLPNPCNSLPYSSSTLAFALFLILIQGATEFVVGRF